MTYTDLELMKVLESVEAEFNTHLAKKEEESRAAVLAKSEDKPFPPKDEKKPEEKEEKPEDKKEEKKPEGKEESKEQPQAAEGEQKPEEKQPEGQAPAAAAAPEGQPQPQGDESHGYDDEDMQHMQKMYMSMSKAELKAHHDACRAALDSQGMQKCGDSAMSMNKSETLTSIEVKVPELEAEATLLKSELSAEKAKTAELQKKVDLAAEFMGKLAQKKSAPQGKSITSLEVITKGEETKTEEKTFSKAEINVILNKKVTEPTLSKSDREAINDYYFGNKDIKIVRHLLA